MPHTWTLSPRSVVNVIAVEDSCCMTTAHSEGHGRPRSTCMAVDHEVLRRAYAYEWNAEEFVPEWREATHSLSSGCCNLLQMLLL